MSNPSNAASVIVITTLAVYQTRFWAEVGEELRRLGLTPVFISFDDRSTDLLHDKNFEVYTPLSHEFVPNVSDDALQAALVRYNIENVNYWLSHERLTFGIKDGRVLRCKLLAYLSTAERVLAHLLTQGSRVVLVQELGGFISVIASYFAARRLSVDNWFIEPSFFRGRLFFLRNHFGAQRIPIALPVGVSHEVDDYLRQTLQSGQIVVPKKDEHQYTSAANKVINLHNLRRLAEKMLDKHVFGKYQEFGYIGRHVSIHMRMLVNSWKLRRHYMSLDRLSRFIYYPLHVPTDMALTLRSPQYLDQLALIEYLARTCPHTHRVVIKEHPAMIGAVDADRVLDLLNRYDNLSVLSPAVNNFEVLRACDAVVSVNSKSGAEAMLLGKPVLILGDAFYNDAPFVRRVESLQELTTALPRSLREPSPLLSQVKCYFQSVWNISYPGELYICNRDNVSRFTASLCEVLTASA